MLRKILCIALFVFIVPFSAQAHKANFFAYVENGEIICEGGFPGGKACRECPVIVKDAASGQELLRVTSNNRGITSFPIDDTLKQAKFGLKLILSGGEGHQAEWLLDPEEYLDVAPAKPASPSEPSMAAQQKESADQRTQVDASEREVERMIAAALERHIGPMLDEKLESKLGPIRRKIAEGADSGPSFVSIVGGLGWFVGVAGIVAWFRSRQGY